MRHSRAAIALIGRHDQFPCRWLVRWNEHWQQYSFVGGHKRQEETYRECLVRELEEELFLTLHRHYRLAAVPRANLNFRAYSQRAERETQYTIEAYKAEIIDDDAWPIVDANSLNLWVTAHEVAAGSSTEGQPIAEVARRTLEWTIESSGD